MPIHFISGLPRSGSTLLSALLRQNPRFHASITSPVGHIFNAMLVATSVRNEGAVFFDDDKRKRLLREVFMAYYGGLQTFDDRTLIFDTNRIWTAKLAALAAIFPHSKILCLVRNPVWILDSIERMVQRNPLQLSAIFNFDPETTVYSRCEALTKHNGLIGAPMAALREAVCGPFADRLMLIRYESLVSQPLDVLDAIYEFLGEQVFRHDTEHIEPIAESVEFDARLGMPGLHEVFSQVRPPTDTTILPPDLWNRWCDGAFWEKWPPGMHRARLIFGPNAHAQ